MADRPVRLVEPGPTGDPVPRADIATPEQRPRSASGSLTGAAGVIAALATALLLRDWVQTGTIPTLVVLAATAAAMIAVDFLLYRVHRNAGRDMSRGPQRGFDALRVARKLVGFWLTIGIIAALYALIPEYQKPFYAPFKEAALLLLPALLVISPFYIAHVDRRQNDPVDAYAELAMLLGGTRPADWRALRTHVLGWLVKAFFIPLMFGFVHNGLAAFWAGGQTATLDFRHVYERLYNLLFLLDVLLATVAYALTLRILDNHVRSVEPTVGGWIICVICYQPLSEIQAPYIQYELDKLHWGDVFAPYPLLYVLWGSAILALIGIYVWATACFGLRFSNLTHRGIITHGPYRWVKHPAYLAKNLTWWMISLPFVAGAGGMVAVQSCLMLGAANLIYYLRARTEERHLAADPVYRAYQDYIAAHGLFARLSGTVRKAAAAG
jgi:protein-S-isoprenylcysteine O-methyltransferase Ste14